ncbi:MAG: hypothetical protein PHW54_05060 [Candidatus Omnitrophica bacterium]|nr:hypothetical protein [Candidatus Omnitrophota bacterium]
MKDVYVIDDENKKLICDKAEWALNLHPYSRKPQKFQHMENVFYASFTGFRVLVNDENGNSVCCRYL